MATVYLGVDSIARATDNACSNEETQNVTNAAGGTNRVTFWGRYFGYKTSYWYPMNWDSGSTIQQELSAMKSIGISRIAPINSPGDVVSKAKSDGSYHGKQACDGIVAVLNNCGGKLIMPASNSVYVYLEAV